jgi:hypothetical protein
MVDKSPYLDKQLKIFNSQFNHPDKKKGMDMGIIQPITNLTETNSKNIPDI